MFASPCAYCGSSLLGRPILEKGLSAELSTNGLVIYVVVVGCPCGKRHADFVIGQQDNTGAEWERKVRSYEANTTLQPEHLTPLGGATVIGDPNEQPDR